MFMRKYMSNVFVYNFAYLQNNHYLCCMNEVTI